MDDMTDWPIQDEFFNPIENTDACNAAISAQWSALLLLLRSGVLSETTQAFRRSPLFGGQDWRGAHQQDTRVFAPGLSPRWDAVPVITVALPYAVRLAKLDSLFVWLAGGWAACFSQQEPHKP